MESKRFEERQRYKVHQDLQYLALGTEEKAFQKVLPVPDITELHEELLTSFSTCGKNKAVFRQVKNKKGEEQQYLEIDAVKECTCNQS
ncbi:hypothetical protein BSL78_06529 [Apostichopus japonicus]|uniref:Uncharacterized protein n=1 Tax=Stichopus japonicus TaxID=307972 RepID=A0A2G8L8H9_STIJA|nr:hypothetical protein BSL78_06529 [Apostichopus japonicus]